MEMIEPTNEGDNMKVNEIRAAILAIDDQTKGLMDTLDGAQTYDKMADALDQKIRFMISDLTALKGLVYLGKYQDGK